MTKFRVLHFGSGGGKGVTRVLTDLAQGHAAGGRFDPLIVFRRKRGKPVGEVFRRDLAACGVGYREVCPRPKYRMLAELRAIIREFRPDVFVAHGYSEHIWGRMAAIAEAVPVVVQAEHAHERYKWLHLRRSRRLATQTDAIVGVSRGVVERLRELGFPDEKLHTIYNGVRVERFVTPTPRPWAEREPAVVMASRFGQPKDQRTLIRAAAVLRDRGMPVRVRLVGGGKRLEIWRAKWLVRWLGLDGLVEFLGPRSDLPEIFWKHQVAVMSTRREGFGLAAVEAMAAGCAVVGSRAPGVEELIEDGRTGWMATTGDPVAFADAHRRGAQPRRRGAGCRGRRLRRTGFGLNRMAAEYEQLFERCSRRSAGRRIAPEAESERTERHRGHGGGGGHGVTGTGI
jgi:glycosyltransferase involved in cell wall biosynthesis